MLLNGMVKQVVRGELGPRLLVHLVEQVGRLEVQGLQTQAQMFMVEPLVRLEQLGLLAVMLVHLVVVDLAEAQAGMARLERMLHTRFTLERLQHLDLLGVLVGMAAQLVITP